MSVRLTKAALAPQVIHLFETEEEPEATTVSMAGVAEEKNTEEKTKNLGARLLDHTIAFAENPKVKESSTNTAGAVSGASAGLAVTALGFPVFVPVATTVVATSGKVASAAASESSLTFLKKEREKDSSEGAAGAPTSEAPKPPADEAARILANTEAILGVLVAGAAAGKTDGADK